MRLPRTGGQVKRRRHFALKRGIQQAGGDELQHQGACGREGEAVSASGGDGQSRQLCRSLRLKRLECPCDGREALRDEDEVDGPRDAGVAVVEQAATHSLVLGAHGMQRLAHRLCCRERLGL
jgi:hypothetical protein